MRVPPPQPASGPNRMIFGGTTSGSFSIKSARGYGFRNSQFGRARQGIGFDTACGICGYVYEMCYTSLGIALRLETFGIS